VIRLLLVCLSLTFTHATARAELAQADSLTAEIEQLMRDARYGEAESLAREQLRMRRDKLGTDPRTAESLRLVAAALWRQGDFTNAYAFAEDSIEMFEETLGEDHHEVGESLNILGLILMRQREHARAEAAYRRALRLLRAEFGDEHDAVAAVISNLGALYSAMGDHVHAEPYRLAALALVQRIYGDEHPTVALALHNLGSVYHGQRRLSEAESYYLAAIEMRRRLLAPDHPELANSIGRLGSLYRQTGRWEEAVPLLEQSLEMARARLGPSPPRVGIDMDVLAACYRSMGRYDEALELSRQVLEIRRATFGDVHKEVVWALLAIASALRMAGRFPEAKELLEESRTIEARLPEDMYVVDQAWASWYLDQGLIEQAEAALSELMRYFEDRIGLRTPRSRRTGFGGTYATVAACRLQLGREADAWPALEASLGRQLSDMLLRGRDDDALQEKINMTRERIEAIEAVRDPGDTSLLSELRIELLESEAELQLREVQSRSLYPPFDHRVYSLERVQSFMDPNTALIGWLDRELPTLGRASWGYVIRDRGPVHWIRLNSQGRAGSSIAPLRKALHGAGAWPERVSADARERSLGRSVATERFDPLEPFLAGASELVVLWPGELLGLPIEVLSDASGEYLVERFAITYSVSATVFAWLREQRSSQDHSSALLVGDPEFSVERHLPRSRSEAQAIAEMFADPLVLLGKDASERALESVDRTRGLDSFDIIHMATHAHIDSEFPERSALLLSTAELPDPKTAALSGAPVRDGRLTARDVATGWKLNAELVTLSGCETGLGREARGEGYIGLAHSFMQAGARSLAVSLWRVDDTVTANLMTRFYENLLGIRAEAMSKATALREAKRWIRSVRDEDGNRPYAHPAYWAGFVLFGDGGGPTIQSTKIMRAGSN